MTARPVAERWGALGQPRLIKDRENKVYEIALPDGTRAALRLHRAGYQTAAAIRSELWWLAGLSEAGLPVPVPVPTLDGALVAEAGGRMATVVSWIEGRQPGDGDTPIDPDAPGVEAHYTALGRLIARMHDATDDLVLPGDFERPRWDREAFTGATPQWGRYWENPALDAGEVELLVAAKDRLDAELRALEASGVDTGLIHADVLRENVLVGRGGLSLIDFDDSGFGFRAYDLATALVQGVEDPMYPVARRAIEAGYRAARRADAPPLGEIETFVALRCFASAGWIVSRARPGDPRLRHYAARAVGVARRILR